MNKKILHIISGLGLGGAEMMLYKLAKYGNNEFCKHIVVSLSDKGTIGPRLEELGIKVYYLRLSLKNFLYALFKLIAVLRQNKPDIVQTWMYHADVIGGFVAYCCGYRNIIWGVRSSSKGTNMSLKTRCFIKLSAWLSYLIPEKIVSNSKSGILSHVELGYDPKLFSYISNGFDIDDFDFNGHARARLRSLWGCDPDSICIGALGRVAWEKNYKNLIVAITKIRTDANIKLVICGRNVDTCQELKGLVIKYNLQSRVLLLPQTDNASQFFNALDAFILPSFYEGFPNVLCEAMCSRLPVIVTDAGDAWDIVGEYGVHAVSTNAEDLASAIEKLLKMSRSEWVQRGRFLRQRVIDNYQISNIINQFADLYTQLLVNEKKSYVI